MIYNNLIKSRYSVVNINTNNLVSKAYVDNQIVLTPIQIKKKLRLKKLANIIGFRKSKEYTGPGYIFVPYIMSPSTTVISEGVFKKSKFYRAYNQKQRLKKLKDILNG